MASIYEFIKDNLNENGCLPTGFNTLPDMKDLTLREEESWVPGAYEGIMLRSDYSIRQPIIINYHIYRQISRYIKNPEDSNYDKLTNTLAKYSAISVIDPVVSLLSRPANNRNNMRIAALRLLKSGEKREVVKVAIAMLGLCGTEEDKDVLKTIGSHEEFTLYVAVASKNILEDYNGFLLDLLSGLHGWGKISAIYELDYSKPESRYYVLTKGCNNMIGLSYLANVCAIKGKLADALEEAYTSVESIDELYKGACDIFTGLLENRAENDTINEYPDAQRASVAFNNIVNSGKIITTDERESYILDKLKSYGLI